MFYRVLLFVVLLSVTFSCQKKAADGLTQKERKEATEKAEEAVVESIEPVIVEEIIEVDSSIYFNELDTIFGITDARKSFLLADTLVRLVKKRCDIPCKAYELVALSNNYVFLHLDDQTDPRTYMSVNGRLDYDTYVFKEGISSDLLKDVIELGVFDLSAYYPEHGETMVDFQRVELYVNNGPSRKKVVTYHEAPKSFYQIVDRIEKEIFTHTWNSIKK